jgi:hypothetical protein
MEVFDLIQLAINGYNDKGEIKIIIERNVIE